MTKSQRIEIRVSEAEKKSWATKAGGQRRVSEWLRSLANAACAGEQVETLDAVGGDQGKVSISTKRLVTPVGGCPRAHHHRPGVYCGTCGKVN